jgi:hypothetical protein
LIKEKLNEIAIDKAKLETENNNLKDKITNLELKLNKSHNNINREVFLTESLMNEDQVKEFTYILIKNFEGKQIDKLNIYEVY